MTRVILRLDNETRRKLEELNPDLAYNSKFIIDDNDNTIGIIIHADWNWSMIEELR